MIIETLNRKIRIEATLFNKHSVPGIPILSYCLLRTILVISALLFAQINPLKASEERSVFMQKSKNTRGRPNLHRPELHQDTNKPSTQSSEVQEDLSERLLKIQPEVVKIKERIIKNREDPIEIIESNLQRYMYYLKCSSCPHNQPSLEKPHTNLLSNTDEFGPPMPGGRSGNEVRIVSRDHKSFVAIKKFTHKDEDGKEKKVNKIEEGLEDLLYSLLAWELNPCPKKLKMVRVCDAILCPKNSLSIIMEAAKGHDIHHCLSSYPNDRKHIVKACAEYLATFHIENYRKLKKNINNTNRGKYLKHLLYSYSTLLEKLPGEKEHLPGEKKETPVMSLEPRKPSRKTELQKMTSNNVIQLLSEREQPEFVNLVKITHKNFKENVKKIYRSLRNKDEEIQYFLTITHGDAHGDNFFYDENGTNGPDSCHRITMIDYASIVKTYGNIGDPAEDVGRFLGSLWDWMALTRCDKNNKNICEYNEILGLQNEFLNVYLNKVKENNINKKIFKKIFIENCNLYKLRFYRAVFNAKKHDDSSKDKEIKKTVLNSWIRENTQHSKHTNKSKHSSNKKTADGNIIYYDPPEGFDESIPTGASQSYLGQLREFFHSSNAHIKDSSSRIAVVTGMAGIGKTAVALAYAHNPKKEYSLIYWLPSSTKDSLIEGYVKLLQKMNGPIADKMNGGNIITSVNLKVSAKDKCLLIYDNVPNLSRFLEFLQGKVLEDILPKNTDILITSRNNAWRTKSFKPKMISLDILSPEDSRKYLHTITGFKKSEEEVAAKLIEKLGHLPLALSHAAHYISLEGGKDVTEKTFNKYLKAFDNDPRTRNFLEEPRPKITYKNLVETTICISGNFMTDSQMTFAKDLIKQAAEYCAKAKYNIPDCIPIEHFTVTNQNNLNDALIQLASLSLIKIPNETTISIHPLVERVTNLQHKQDIPNKIYNNILPVKGNGKEIQRHNKEVKKNKVDIKLISGPTLSMNSKLTPLVIIKSVDNGQVLDNLGANNSHIGVWKQYGGSRQLWRIIKHDQGYIIKSVNNGQVLDNFEATKSHIGVWEQYGGLKQQWKIIEHDQGYIIKSVHNNQVLDNFGANNSHIGVWNEEDGNRRQLWLILQ